MNLPWTLKRKSDSYVAEFADDVFPFYMLLNYQTTTECIDVRNVILCSSILQGEYHLRTMFKSFASHFKTIPKQHPYVTHFDTIA